MGSGAFAITGLVHPRSWILTSARRSNGFQTLSSPWYIQIRSAALHPRTEVAWLKCSDGGCVPGAEVVAGSLAERTSAVVLLLVVHAEEADRVEVARCRRA